MKTIKMKIFQRKWLLTLSLLAVVFITACKKDNSTNNPSNETVTASIFGRVTDENGNSVSGATASAGGKSITTDLNGIFKLNNVTLNKKYAFVKINKAGFFDGSRTFIASSGKINNVQIRLLTKTLKGSFTASTGATINVTANASVQFPANAIKNADGSVYSGTVKVYAAFLDPTDAELFSKMPGDLMGTRTDNSESLLRSFGMLNVELEDASGNKLNIANGKEATLSMTVPASLISAAPTSIPLWYFDTNTGVWKEEGTATLSGNKYIGTVKHFSWWNCDTPAASAFIKMRLVDLNGHPYSNVWTNLTNINNGDNRFGFADNNGVTQGQVYANQLLKLEVLDACNVYFFIQNIGPFTQNSTTDLGDIVVSLPSNQISGSYQGKLMDCNSNAVSNGYVIYTYNGRENYVPTDANGNFNFNMVSCGTTLPITFTGFDLNNNKLSLEQSIAHSAGAHNIDNIIVCEASQEYVNFQVDGGSMISIIPPVGTVYFSDFYIEARRNGNDSARIYMYTNNAINNTGSYVLNSLLCNTGSDYYYTSDPTGLSTIITNYASTIGEYYEGSVTGSFIDFNTQATHTINCNYRIKRTQ
jgi:hypothetical protein